MKIYALILLSFVPLALGARSVGQWPKQALDLPQAEAIALQRAPQIAAAYFREQASKQGIRVARSALFPQLTVNITAVGTGNDIENVFGGKFHVASKPTRLGAVGGLNNPTVFSRESNGVMLEQLVTDFGRTSNLISAAKFQALSESEKTRLARAQVLLQVDSAYYQALAAQALRQVAQKAVAERNLAMQQTEALVNSKLKSSLDLSFARVDFENAKLLLVEAQNGEEKAQAQLSAAMGLPETQHFTLVDQPEVPLPTASLEKLTSQALAFRPELIALRNERNAAIKLASAERAARFPKVSVLGSIGRTPVGEPDVFGNYSAAGINFELPIWTGGRLSSRQAEAMFRAKATAKTLQEAENQIAKEIHDAFFDVTSTYEKIQAAKELVATTDQALALARSRFRLGITSAIELSQAQLNQTQAQIDFATAKYQLLINQSKLLFQASGGKFHCPGL